MPRNVEIKARLRDRPAVERIVREHADHGPELIVQEDVFFTCDRGRLKLRSFTDGRAEMIFYRRPDTEGPSESDFVKVATGEPGPLRELLTAALGEAGTVRKRRTLYRVEQTRVHLDEVDGIGDWLELEVVLEDGQSTEDGVAIAESLLKVLGVAENDLVAEAYVDLLASSSDTQDSQFIIHNS